MTTNKQQPARDVEDLLAAATLGSGAVVDPLLVARGFLLGLHVVEFQFGLEHVQAQIKQRCFLFGVVTLQFNEGVERVNREKKKPLLKPATLPAASACHQGVFQPPSDYASTAQSAKSR
jgi:hypothetical protein